MKGRVLTVDFTKSFIAELSAYIEKEYLFPRKSMRRLAIVFGGKRPALFLKRELARRNQRTLELPDFFAIDDLMLLVANRSGYLAPSSGELDECFDIFNLIRVNAPELLNGRETFARFLPWARELRGFIEQADLEDVPADKLLNIEQSARIGFPVPEGVNRSLEKISAVREAFHRGLLARGMATRGMQYLRAKEVSAGEILPQYEEIVFANFFHFHRTEELVVRRFYESGQATLIFQGDQRKWDVLARLSSVFGCDITEGPVPVPVTYELKVHAAFDTHSEAAITRDILENVADPQRTVIVLPDAGTLVPLISSLPLSVQGFNVSMGYPLNRGSLYVLLRFLFAAQQSCRSGRYYSRDYLKVLRHPFVKNLKIFEDTEILRVLVHKIDEALTGRFVSSLSGMLFLDFSFVLDDDNLFAEVSDVLKGRRIEVSPAELKSGLESLHGLCFESWQRVVTVADFTVVLGEFLDVLTQGEAWNRYPLNGNIAQRVYAVKEELAAAFFSGEAMAADDIARIFMDRLQRELVKFTGAPLKGLQILGLFETRSLDFDDVIILDVNEGVLPRIDVRSSLIPREVLALLGLERMEEEEDIQRYQFMRVISSAKRVHLVYQETREKAPSRFVEELVWEEQKKRGDVVPFPTERAGFALRPAVVRRQIPKTALILDFLRDFVFSATSVNTYLENPFRFYQTFVLGLREPEDLLDEPDAVLVGKFWHRLLEEIFKPLLGKSFVFSQTDVARAWRLFESLFEEYFSRRMRADAFLTRAVAEHKLRAVLEDTLLRADTIDEVLGVEKFFEGRIRLPCGDIRFRSCIDRLDRLKDGRIMVIDYKTGGSDKMPPASLLLPQVMSREVLYKNLGSFQLPLYIHFAAQAYPGKLVDAGLYRLREVQLKTIFETVPAVSPDEFLAPYLTALNFLVARIMDPGIPFEDDELTRIA